MNLAQFHYKPGNMEFPSVVLTLIFSFMEIEDLVRAARVCKDWWKVISRGVYLKEAEPYELDLSRSGDAYRFVPLKMFALLTHLNISSTGVSNRHFEQHVTYCRKPRILGHFQLFLPRAKLHFLSKESIQPS